MATKNCPHCNKQVPVACKKCGCGHLFFATRRSATSTSRDRDSNEGADFPEQLLDIPPGEAGTSGGQGQPTRRSGRVVRERPNFYDALEYENQTRRQKILRRKQSKQPRSDEHDDGSDEGEGEGKSSQSTSSSQKSSHEKSIKVSLKPGEPEVKKRRGRPPGITGTRKAGQGYKIHHNRASVRTRRPSNGQGINKPDSPGVEKARLEEEENVLALITPEKALQYNIVLQDINSKIGRVGWKAP